MSTATQTYPARYALIQFCPDPVAAEVANVGVLLHCSRFRFLRAMLAEDHERVRRMFGLDASLVSLYQAKLNIADKINRRFIPLWELRPMLARQQNSLMVTELRAMRCGEPERELRELFERCVERTLQHTQV